MDTLSRRIRELRLAQGLTQAALAEKARLSGAVVFNIEHGKVVRPKSLCQIAQALRVDPMELARLLMDRVVAVK